MFREEMKAAAEEGNLRSRRSVLAKFSMPKATGWLTGAIIVAPMGWRSALAALGALTVEAVVEAWQERGGRVQRALHHHYVTLAAPPTETE